MRTSSILGGLFLLLCLILIWYDTYTYLEPNLGGEI